MLSEKNENDKNSKSELIKTKFTNLVSSTIAIKNPKKQNIFMKCKLVLFKYNKCICSKVNFVIEIDNDESLNIIDFSEYNDNNEDFFSDIESEYSTDSNTDQSDSFKSLKNIEATNKEKISTAIRCFFLNKKKL